MKRQKTKPVDRNGNPITHRQKELTRIKNKLIDLRNKTCAIDFTENSGTGVLLADGLRAIVSATKRPKPDNPGRDEQEEEELRKEAEYMLRRTCIQ